MTEHNLALARRHYGLDTLHRVVDEALTRLGVAA
jgi:hypothetical protein